MMFESGAICAYLADKFPDNRMAPPLGTVERGLYEQWMYYSNAGEVVIPARIRGVCRKRSSLALRAHLALN
jgi:glutathione S-transferase